MTGCDVFFRCIVVLVLVFLLIRGAVLAAAFAITTWLLSGMDVSGGFWAYLWVSALFGIVNAIIGTILRILTLPLTLLTLGLFAIVVNALMLELTDALTSHLTIDDFFWTAIWGRSSWRSSRCSWTSRAHSAGAEAETDTGDVAFQPRRTVGAAAAGQLHRARTATSGPSGS
jgi:putative membrane protein